MSEKAAAAKILLIDDEKKLVRLVRVYLVSTTPSLQVHSIKSSKDFLAGA